jgi:hypothetical protein
MNAKQWKEILALCMIGDGLFSLWRPSQHYRLWSSGPTWECEPLEEFSRRPNLIRAIGALELLFGLWLAYRQTEDQ